MNDHNLDDLIIGDPETGSKNSKTLLTIIALLVVILIVGLILWALLFDAPDTGPSPTPQNQTQPLDPSLTPLDPAGEKMPALTPDPIKEPVTPAPVPKPKPKPKPTPKPQPKPTPVVQPDPEPVPAVKPTPTPPPKKAAQQTAAPSPGGELIKNADKTIYYIQVGAFKRDPSPRFMQKLKDAGFTFITKTSKGIRRVRVGPYDSYSEAKAALPVVKKKIGVDGLIVKF